MDDGVRCCVYLVHWIFCSFVRSQVRRKKIADRFHTLLNILWQRDFVCYCAFKTCNELQIATDTNNFAHELHLMLPRSVQRCTHSNHIWREAERHKERTRIGKKSGAHNRRNENVSVKRERKKGDVVRALHKMCMSSSFENCNEKVFRCSSPNVRYISFFTSWCCCCCCCCVPDFSIVVITAACIYILCFWWQCYFLYSSEYCRFNCCRSCELNSQPPCCDNCDDCIARATVSLLPKQNFTTDEWLSSHNGLLCHRRDRIT